MKTPRCPHCSSPKLDGKQCRACGRSTDEVPELPRIPDLERSSLVPDEERAQRIDAAAGEGAARLKSAKPDERRCMKCGLSNKPDRKLCAGCSEKLPDLAASP
jgi:hypothetical protein